MYFVLFVQRIPTSWIIFGHEPLPLCGRGVDSLLCHRAVNAGQAAAGRRNGHFMSDGVSSVCRDRRQHGGAEVSTVTSLAEVEVAGGMGSHRLAHRPSTTFTLTLFNAHKQKP